MNTQPVKTPGGQMEGVCWQPTFAAVHHDFYILGYWIY